MSRLAVHFVKPARWVLPLPFNPAFLDLMELLISDVPPTWDNLWQCLPHDLPMLRVPIARRRSGECQSRR
jgi:hypothetical protein